MRLKNTSKLLLISILTLLISTQTSHEVFGQIFNGGQNPPSVVFKQINTPRFQIIYPSPLKEDAQRMANTLEKIIGEVSNSLGHSPHPISIILQGNSVESNGFVQMAPRRSEFYTMPSQEFDAQDWLNSLAVHELRHVVQFDKLAPHLNAPLFEELKLALFGINLPSWFFEGDAVVTETLLSPAGRGRQPNFDLVFRTNILSDKPYSYSKNYFGSYRDFTPGYYPLGYFMTSKIRRDFGEDILNKIMNRISSFPIRPYNFSSSLKKYGNYGTQKLFKNTIEELDSLWLNQLDKSKFKTYQNLNKIDSKNPSNYLLPFAINEDEIVCLKKSKADVNAITLISKIGEKKIIKIGSQTEDNLSYANHKIVWDEYRSDKRYQKQSFSVICLFDMAKQKFRQLTHRSKFFSPSLSPDGKKIITVKVSEGNQFNLVELDAENGKEIKIYPNPKNFTLQTPTYNADASEIVVTAVNQDGKTLMLYHCEDEKSTLLFAPERQIISRPCFAGDQIIYKAHYNGIDNIFAFDLLNKEKTQISFSKFGAYNPSVDTENHKLYFNDYQSTGQNIVSIDLETTKSISLEKTINNTVEYFKPLITQENTSDVFQNIPKKIYPSKPYKEVPHLFYFHSILPVLEADDFPSDYKIGFDLASDNKLNTFSSSVGYSYNSALHTNEFRAALSYQKYYPIVNIKYSNVERLAYAKDTINGKTLIIPFQWRENNTELKVLLPFFSNWLNKNFSAGLQIGTSFTNRYNFTQKVAILKKVVFPMEYEFYAGINTTRSSRDLAPSWGSNFNVAYHHLPFQNSRNGNILTLKSLFYTPGILPNHSFQLNYNWQNASGAYNGIIDISRASSYANLAPIAKLYDSFLLAYKFPIAYPDWEIGPLAYVKRFKGGLFSDFENISHDGGWRSYGLTFSADMNLLRFYLPNFELASKFIIPAEKNNTKNAILELGLNFAL